MLVVTFMVVAYGLFGLFANISLVLNVILIIGALSTLGATLTLPGIAGIVLTIGMAVDANVLIYERIREEQNSGKSVLASINAGFQRAWGTIIDSHLTQLIAAVVLYFLGSGPVQGFAVTLALGILTSLFTAYTVTLFFVGIWFRARRPKTLRIQHFRFIPDGTKIDFMKISKTVIILSIILTFVSIGSAVFKGFNFGIDFKGGSAIEVQHTGGRPGRSGAAARTARQARPRRNPGAGLRHAAGRAGPRRNAARRRCRAGGRGRKGPRQRSPAKTTRSAAPKRSGRRCRAS